MVWILYFVPQDPIAPAPVPVPFSVPLARLAASQDFGLSPTAPYVLRDTIAKQWERLRPMVHALLDIGAKEVHNLLLRLVAQLIASEKLVDPALRGISAPLAQRRQCPVQQEHIHLYPRPPAMQPVFLAVLEYTVLCLV